MMLQYGVSASYYVLNPLRTEGWLISWQPPEWSRQGSECTAEIFTVHIAAAIDRVTGGGALLDHWSISVIPPIADWEHDSLWSMVWQRGKKLLHNSKLIPAEMSRQVPHLKQATIVPFPKCFYSKWNFVPKLKICHNEIELSGLWISSVPFNSSDHAH